MFVKRVLLPGHHHPCKQQGATPGYDVHPPLVPHKRFHGAAVDTGVNGHKIHTLFSVSPDHPQEILWGDFQQILLQVANGVVHGYGADHGGGLCNQLPAEGVGFTIIAQVHNGLCAKLQGQVHLLHLHVVAVAVAGDAQVDVDLGAESSADALRGNGGVVDVTGNGHFTLGDQLAKRFRLHVLLFGDQLHFRRHNAPLCGFHLGFVSSHGGDSFRQKFVGAGGRSKIEKREMTRFGNFPFLTSFVSLRWHDPNQVYGSKVAPSSQPVIQTPQLCSCWVHCTRGRWENQELFRRIQPLWFF